MKKITILSLHLGYGGIEKCISSLANKFIDEYEIEIISTYKLSDNIPFFINPKVRIKYLMDYGPNKKELLRAIKKFNIKNIIKESIKSLKILRLKKRLMIEEIKNCNSDIIISTRDIHNMWVGKYAKKNILKIGWEHNHHNNNNKYIKKIIKSVSNLDYFILVSKELKKFYEKKVKPKCIYIPNALDEIPTVSSSLNEKRIITVGRLSKEKGYLDLIEIFSSVHKLYPDWVLEIIGDGPLKKTIQDKIDEKSLSKVVKIHGYQNKQYINKMYEKSSIFVSTSYTESFGIVAIEAFSYGIPVVAFSSAQGLKEIIGNNWNGYLIENRDINKYIKKLCELIKNENRRIIMGRNAKKESIKYDGVENKKLWDEIFSNLDKVI